MQWPRKPARPLRHYRLDAAGLLSALDRAADPAAPACVHLPPGACLLRRFKQDGLRAKEIEPALALWAESSLPESIDAYVWDSWIISASVQGLVAIRRVPLDRVRQQLSLAGAPLKALRVPELMPPAQRHNTLVLWDTPEALLACLWDQQVLYEWQSFAPGPPTRPTLEQIEALAKAPPAQILCADSSGEVNRFWDAVGSIWPNAKPVAIEMLDPLASGHLLDQGAAFLDYLRELERQPASVGDKLRLSLAVAGACLTGLFFFNADVTYRERQVEQLRHQISLLKVRAKRSETLAARSGETLRQVRALRAMTVGRNGVTKVLQVLSDSLPSRVRIETVSVERSGTIALDGLAETEVDISSFLERLRRSPQLREASLSFSEKDTEDQGAEALIQFRLEVRWTQPLLSLPAGTSKTPTALMSTTQRNRT